jgi:hypothetical protein
MPCGFWSSVKKCRMAISMRATGLPRSRVWCSSGAARILPGSRKSAQRRADPAARRVAARDALLRWAYKRAADGQPVAASGFSLSRYARFLSTRGDLFSYTEITSAVDWLARHGYLHAAGIGGDMIVTIIQDASSGYRPRRASWGEGGHGRAGRLGRRVSRRVPWSRRDGAVCARERAVVGGRGRGDADMDEPLQRA